MIPVVAIVGRPNVGKSTLFNALAKRREALVLDVPGVTRDRLYQKISLSTRDVILVDTGGIGEDESGIQAETAKQSQLAIQEADVILLMVDATVGSTHRDELLAKKLRAHKKPVWVVVNKIDAADERTALSDFFRLGLGEPLGVSAAHYRGMEDLKETIEKSLPAEVEKTPEDLEQEQQAQGIKIAIVGRPNVGKSTLVNRILGEERVVVFDKPGTTTDSIYIPFERQGRPYTLIDTAGVRRKARVDEALEKFSVIKTLKAIDDAHVVIFVIDAVEGITDQDLTVLGYVLDAGRSLIIAANKWDGLEKHHKEQVKTALGWRLNFVKFAKIHFISALHGSGVGSLLTACKQCYLSASRKVSTSRMTELLEEAVEKAQPPLVSGRRIKLRYAHLGGHHPPVVVIHGNQTDAVPGHYTRYLENFFREALRLVGTPIRISYKGGENPYADKRNTLTPRQEYQRKRLMRHVKKK